MKQNIKKSMKWVGSILVLMMIMTTPAYAKLGTVMTNRLNIRFAPSTHSFIAGKLQWGDRIVVSNEANNGWYKMYKDGKKYYVSAEYVSVDGETPKMSPLGHFTLTAYCGCARCCGVAGNLTASGTVPSAGRTVAMGGIPFGTKLMINGHLYVVEDRGTPYGHVDIFFNSHQEAVNFGMQSADVYVVE